MDGWTADFPTEPGWYFLRRKGSELCVCRAWISGGKGGRLVVWHGHGEFTAERTRGGVWYRIPMPKVPTAAQMARLLAVKEQAAEPGEE